MRIKATYNIPVSAKPWDVGTLQIERETSGVDIKIDDEAAEALLAIGGKDSSSSSSTESPHPNPMQMMGMHGWLSRLMGLDMARVSMMLKANRRDVRIKVM